MYLLYPATVGGYSVSQIPTGQTAEQTAESFGLTMAVCAEFDMASFDSGSENFPGSFELINRQPAANEVRFNLASCKEYATVIVKSNYSSLQQTALNNFPLQAIAAQSSLAEADRIPSVQSVINQVNVLSEQLEVNLAAITAATDATEVSNATFPPTGIISIGRGQFGGALDLNQTNYVEFNSNSLVQSETELYVPGTGITLGYGENPPGEFNSDGPCFVEGDYLIQIRVAATNVVLAEFEVPLSTDGSNQNISF
jgi:hypothetical protein